MKMQHPPTHMQPQPANTEREKLTITIKRDGVLVDKTGICDKPNSLSSGDSIVKRSETRKRV
jgi:hypothetical protein